MFRRANEILNAPAEGTERKIKPLTEVLQGRKLKLLGHVLRRDRQHPLHQSTFSSSLAFPRETEHRRAGRPRQSWTLKNMERAWDIIQNQDHSQPNIPFRRQNQRTRERIIRQAHSYEPPFHRG